VGATFPVGKQVSGTIQQLFADYSSPVTKGQLIARSQEDRDTAQAANDAAGADLEAGQVSVRAASPPTCRSRSDISGVSRRLSAGAVTVASPPNYSSIQARGLVEATEEVCGSGFA